MKKHWYLMDGDALRAKYFRAAFFWGNGWLYQYGIQKMKSKESEENKQKPVAVSRAPVYYGPLPAIGPEKKTEIHPFKRLASCFREIFS
jgi:hypothetical protein